MPIPREEFELLREMGASLGEEIVNFLGRHRQAAFTSTEIVRALFPTTVILPIGDPLVAQVETTLQSLLVTRAIVGRVFETPTGNVRYFAVP